MWPFFVENHSKSHVFLPICVPKPYKCNIARFARKYVIFLLVGPLRGPNLARNRPKMGQICTKNRPNVAIFRRKPLKITCFVPICAPKRYKLSIESRNRNFPQKTSFPEKTSHFGQKRPKTPKSPPILPQNWPKVGRFLWKKRKNLAFYAQMCPKTIHKPHITPTIPDIHIPKKEYRILQICTEYYWIGNQECPKTRVFRLFFTFFLKTSQN